MKFSALALDYDGTIARDGALDPEVRSAIAEVRSRGIAVVIVTGRILEELRQVTGGLGFVDAVVAENGAVLDFPGGNSRLIGHPVQPIFLEELRRRGIEFKAGQCVVETDATWAPQVLAVIRELELPLTLVFNRGRLMMLPQSTGKGAGLREALSCCAFRLTTQLQLGTRRMTMIYSPCANSAWLLAGVAECCRQVRMKCSPEMVQAPWRGTSEKRPRRCDYPLNALIELAWCWVRWKTDTLSH
jgi:hypothetical protein